MDDPAVVAVRPERVQCRIEQRELRRGVRIVGLVGHRQVRADTGEVELRALRDALGEGEGVVGIAPDPVHARVDLEVQ